MSELELGIPVDWNIVIAGAWNIAILTPNGIATRLFGLDPGTPVEVQVAVDIRAPIQVKHENIIVQPSPTGLVISPQISSPDLLEKSVAIAKRALMSLPETPLSAAGLNLRYHFDNIPNSLIDACVSTIDDKLSDEGFIIKEKILKRQIEWMGGILNLDINEKSDATALMVFNYHQNSSKPSDLSNWVEKYNDMLENANKIKGTLINE